MKLRKIMFGLLAAGLSVMSASACLVQVRVACPGDKNVPGVRVWLDGVGTTYTDDFGIATFTVNAFGTYNVCVDTTTLPAGSKLSPNCQKMNVQDDAPPVLNFIISGDFCTPVAPGPCW